MGVSRDTPDVNDGFAPVPHPRDARLLPLLRRPSSTRNQLPDGVVDMEWHPYAKLFPMLSDEEIESLADDIRANGLHEPIVVDSDDRIIDGRNRAAACKIAGVNPAIVAKDMDDRETLAFVVSHNLKRRHLSESQRADVAAKMANIKVGDNQHKRGSANRPTHKDEPVISQHHAAAMLNVSERSVRRAAKVHAKGSDELKAAVASGEVTVNRAEQIADLPQSQQAEAIKQNPREIKVGPPENNGASAKPSKAIQCAHDAINCLMRIPKNDPQRKRGFQIVTDFIKANRGGV